METKSENYDAILNRFVSSDDLRVYLQKPMNAGNKTVASNAHSLVAVPKCGEYPDFSDKVSGIYPLDANLDVVIPLVELKEMFNKLPTVDCYDDTIQRCDACYGSGEVEFEFTHAGECYGTDDTCPVCDGEGKTLQQSNEPNGKKELDPDKYLQIGNSVFNIERIQELIFVAELLQSDIRLIHQSEPNRASLFSIKEVDVLVMPEPPHSLDRDSIAQKFVF